MRRSTIEEARAHERTSAAVVGHAPFESRGGEPFAHATGQIGRVAHQRAPGEEHRVERSRLVRRRIAQCDDFGIPYAEDSAVGAEDMPFVVDHRELFGLVEPRLHEQLAPVAHTVGSEHVNRAVRRAVTAEAAAAKRMVHVVVRLHELGHRGGALVSGKGHDAVVRFLNRAHIEARFLEHLAAKRAALAMRALHLLVCPAGKHAERRRSRLVDLGQLVCGQFPHPRLFELPRFHGEQCSAQETRSIRRNVARAEQSRERIGSEPECDSIQKRMRAPFYRARLHAEKSRGGKGHESLIPCSHG